MLKICSSYLIYILSLFHAYNILVLFIQNSCNYFYIYLQPINKLVTNVIKHSSTYNLLFIYIHSTMPLEQQTNCKMVANNRSRMEPPISKNYFGNCINVMCMSSTVAWTWRFVSLQKQWRLLKLIGSSRTLAPSVQP